DLPSPSRFEARDGARLTFRAYPAAARSRKGSVVLVHGSSGKGSGMHALAKAFAAAGYAAYALDIRGHGDSGDKGKIAYVGQLEDDLEDFVRSVKPPHPVTLGGFSSGGGFVLRFAGSARQNLFSNYLLLSPFISQDAPTYRPNAGGWVSVGVPRWFAIGVLDAFGMRLFNDLPVIRFALDERDKAALTPQYSFSLAQNFRPERDYRANIRAVKQPLSVVAGADDEVFHADKFAMVFKAEGKDIAVTLVPGIGHINLTLDPRAVQAAVSAVKRMNEPSV
ncbi:MAG: alpha/beta fold hydrolase, partial [Burkholderiales bacterium]